jgi:hypothetical protein
MPPDGPASIAQSPEDLRTGVKAHIVEGKPTFFKLVRIGAAAFDGVDRHGRICPDGSEMRGNSVENKQVELIISNRWFR